MNAGGRQPSSTSCSFGFGAATAAVRQIQQALDAVGWRKGSATARGRGRWASANQSRPACSGVSP